MPINEEHLRIDKWLWAVRIYKTRSIATDECNKGRVLINGNPVKASHVVKVGEIILVRKLPVIYTYKVLGLIKNRGSAQVVKGFVEDLTSNEELAKRELARVNLNFQRDQGAGRPTKKDRREIDRIKEI
jgi:ribosome-associated heat shock protein Hsp15